MKSENSFISPDELALIAEKGLKAVRISKLQKKYLLEKGLGEIYAIHKFQNEEINTLDPESVETIIDKFYSGSQISDMSPLKGFLIKLREDAVKLISGLVDWEGPSPAFACRGTEDSKISFYKETGRLTVHVEIVLCSKHQADINIRLTDDTRRERTSFEVQLFQEDKCREVKVLPFTGLLSFPSLNIGNYRLYIGDEKGEITSLTIRMES